MLFAAEEISLKVDGVPFDLDALRAEKRRLRAMPPKANAGASRPSLFTMRWQGMTPGRGFMCRRYPTAREARGEPHIAAICP